MIIKETHWTRKYLMWGVSWVNIQMMIADAPSFKRTEGSSKDNRKVVKNDKELIDFLGL